MKQKYSTNQKNREIFVDHIRGRMRFVVRLTTQFPNTLGHKIIQFRSHMEWTQCNFIKFLNVNNHLKSENFLTH